MKFWYFRIFRTSVEKIQFLLISDKNGWFFSEDVSTFVRSLWILLRKWNVSDKICRENQNTHFMFNNFFFRQSCRLWDNVEKCGRTVQATDDNTIRSIRFLCWISKATHTHTHTHTHTLRICNTYSFVRQRWFREGPSMLNLHVHSLSCSEALTANSGAIYLPQYLFFAFSLPVMNTHSETLCCMRCYDWNNGLNSWL